MIFLLNFGEQKQKMDKKEMASAELPADAQNMG